MLLRYCTIYIQETFIAEKMSAKVVNTFICNLSVPNPDFIASAWTQEIIQQRLPPSSLCSLLYKNLFKYTSHTTIINKTKQILLLVLPKNLWCFRDFSELVRVVREVSCDRCKEAWGKDCSHGICHQGL